MAGGDFNAADRLGREYADYLLLILDDLGWGDGSGEPVELTTTPDVQRRVFTHLRDMAVVHTATVEEEQQESRELERRASLVIEACRAVLADLDGA